MSDSRIQCTTVNGVTRCSSVVDPIDPPFDGTPERGYYQAPDGGGGSTPGGGPGHGVGDASPHRDPDSGESVFINGTKKQEFFSLGIEKFSPSFNTGSSSSGSGPRSKGGSKGGSGGHGTGQSSGK